MPGLRAWLQYHKSLQPAVTSAFLGVRRHYNSWRTEVARPGGGNDTVYNGKNEEEAARAYDRAVIQRKGRCAQRGWSRRVLLTAGAGAFCCPACPAVQR